MCEFASFVVTQNQILWFPFCDSHSEILRRSNIKDETEFQAKHIVKIEVIPKTSTYKTDDFKEEDWNYIVDEEVNYIPSWYSDNESEYRNRVFSALRERLETEKGECRVEFENSSGAKFEYWYLDGEYHRKDGPAKIETFANGTKLESWYLNGNLHREDGPAVIEIYPDGSKKEYWYLNGKLHRKDGPALTETWVDGPKYEIWFLYGYQMDSPKEE